MSLVVRKYTIRQLFSWWKRAPLFLRHCSGEAGHYFETDAKPDMEVRRCVLGWCRYCGELREVEVMP